MFDPKDPIHHVALLSVIGALVGLGQILSDGVRLTPRSIVGRCIMSAGLGASASIALSWLPELPLAAQYGLAAGMASLGTSGLTLIFQKYVSK